jgi:23S rRNA (guanine745-N1)-methyltransferase
VLADVVPYLACVHCGGSVSPAERSLRCENGHVFDIARQGYVSMLSGDAHTGTADTPDMVAAREEFLGEGHYEPVLDAAAEAIREALGPDPEGLLVEVGAGTGYYLSGLLDRAPRSVGLALDLSKAAARRAARAHPRAGAAVADTWKALPLLDGAAAAVVDVFAPRNAPEFARVLDPEGVLVVVTPTPRHLREIVLSLGLLSVDEDKDARLRDALEGLFTRSASVEVEAVMDLDRYDVATLIAMGPSAWHTDEEEMDAAISALPEPLAVTLSVTVGAYRPSKAPPT